MLIKTDIALLNKTFGQVEAKGNLSLQFECLRNRREMHFTMDTNGQVSWNNSLLSQT